MPPIISYENYTIPNNCQRSEHLCIKAACQLPADILQLLQDSLHTEKSSTGREILQQCINNANIAASQHLPICQDTGFAVFFVTMGTELAISGGTISQAINCGVEQGYKEGYLRNSIVSDPLFDRKNTGNNTPAVISLEIVPGDKLTITILPKGGGCENMSALVMLKPSEGKQGVIDFVVDTVSKAGGNPCPPLIVGVGIGGTADTAMYLAKKALLRELELHILTKDTRTLKWSYFIKSIVAEMGLRAGWNYYCSCGAYRNLSLPYSISSGSSQP